MGQGDTLEPCLDAAGTNTLVYPEPVRGQHVKQRRPGEGDMPERDDEPPKTVIPFGDFVGFALAEQLNEFYGELVGETLPSDLLALAEQLAVAMARNKEKA
jgi:hypothetical protein